MIGNLGENLSVLIYCNHSVAHDWMSFLCWYSFYKNLPEAKIAVGCSRSNLRFDLYFWTKRLNIDFEYMKGDSPISYMERFSSKGKLSLPCLLVTPDILSVREMDGHDGLFGAGKNSRKRGFMVVNDPKAGFEPREDLFCEAVENKISNFVSYSQGWGNFNTAEWIDRDVNALTPYMRLSKSPSGLNEKRISELWHGAVNVFKNVSRG